MSSSISNSLQTCNNLDEIKLKKRKRMKYKTYISKNKLFYIYDDKSCNNNFIDWCKLMNKIKLNIEGRGDGNDIERILDEVKKMKNELYKV